MKLLLWTHLLAISPEVFGHMKLLGDAQDSKNFGFTTWRGMQYSVFERLQKVSFSAPC